ncbi:hypothetical protein FDH96_gp153 [Mycobacterium phage Rey]|uniref:Uncharacterized protein n=1 Tax=Mycobacterium phage Rey TaxID=1034115 RepID=G1D5G6_9CAUD|nr:hypothetical protein FDH96_gp153 [Mycobacterium phage Rey]AEK10015.1 hypothetical protein PBI_REY_107 [Mycobacterium phage Rey]
MGMQDKVEEQSEAWQPRAVTMIVCELVDGSGNTGECDVPRQGEASEV